MFTFLERQFVIDFGASMLMLSEKELSSGGLEIQDLDAP